MRLGLYGEGEATLRMKGDLQSPNPCMWDMVAYRVKLTPHPHAGDKWFVSVFLFVPFFGLKIQRKFH
jgi:glutaminyl-tRNA synthetase